MAKTILLCAFALSMVGMALGCAPYVGVVSSIDGRAHVFNNKTAYVCQTTNERPVCAEVNEK